MRNPAEAGSRFVRRVIQEPLVITLLRYHAQSGNSTPESIFALLKKRNFTLPPQEEEAYFLSAQRYQEHRQAADAAQKLYRKDSLPLVSKVKNVLDIPSNDSDMGIRYFSASIAVKVDDDVFDAELVKTYDKYGIDPKNVTRADGITDAYSVPIANNKLPFSLVRKSADRVVANKTAAVLEWRYFHPDADQPDDPIAYREQLRETVQDAVTQSDEHAFKTTVHQFYRRQLNAYLQILTVQASAGKAGAYELIFGDPHHFSAAVFQKELAAIRNGLPENPQQRELWERMLAEGQEKVQHKAQFIDAAYQDLMIYRPDPGQDAYMERQDHEQMLHAITLSLTPEQGYKIKAHAADKPSFDDLKQWEKEYENTTGGIIVEFPTKTHAHAADDPIAAG